MSQYRRTRDERFSITMGTLLIAVTALGATFLPPMPGEAAIFGIIALVYGLTGPMRRRRLAKIARQQAREARQLERKSVIW